MQKSVLTIAFLFSAALQFPVSAAVFLPQLSVQPNRQLAQVNASSTAVMTGGQGQLMERAIAAAQTIPDAVGQSLTFVKIASLYLQYGQPERAAAFLTRTRTIADTITDPKTKAQTLINIASVENQLPQPPGPLARISELQALIAAVPATVDRDFLFLGLAQLQADQGQLDQLTQSLAQIRDPDRTEFIEYGALVNYGFWVFQTQHFEQAIAQIEQTEQFPPLTKEAIPFLPHSSNSSAADLAIADRIQLLTYLFERAEFFRPDQVSMAQSRAQQRVLFAKIQQQITRLQDPDLQLKYQIRWEMTLSRSGEFQPEAVAQYEQLLGTIATHQSPALERAAILSTITVNLADPSSPLAQKGFQLAEMLLRQVDDSQLTGKVFVLHSLAATLLEVQPERSLRLTQQASSLIARVPQAADRAKAWIKSAQLYQSLNRSPAAIAALEQVKPLLAEVEEPELLAIGWYYLGQFDQIEQIVDQNRSSTFLITLATFYIEKGALDQALALKDKATQPFVQTEILQQVSYAYIRGKQFDRAATLIQQAIALSQTSTSHPEVQPDFNPTLLSTLDAYAKAGAPVEFVFQLVDLLDQPEMKVVFYSRWLTQGRSMANSEMLWQRFEAAIKATDPKLRNSGWSRFALTAGQLQQPERLEQAIVAIQDPQVKADTLLVLMRFLGNVDYPAP